MVTIPKYTFISLVLVGTGLWILVVCDLLSLGAWNIVSLPFTLGGLYYGYRGYRYVNRTRNRK